MILTGLHLYCTKYLTALNMCIRDGQEASLHKKYIQEKIQGARVGERGERAKNCPE